MHYLYGNAEAFSEKNFKNFDKDIRISTSGKRFKWSTLLLVFFKQQLIARLERFQISFNIVFYVLL